MSKRIRTIFARFNDEVTNILVDTFVRHRGIWDLIMKDDEISRLGCSRNQTVGKAKKKQSKEPLPNK